MNKPMQFKAGMIISALLAVLGIVCWILQLTQGLQLTHMNDYMTWGLYIIGFMLFTGITAGSLIFTSSAYLFPSMAEYKPYTRISAYVGAICGIVAAGLFIFVDIGNPERVWHIVTNAHLASPMFWDTVILTAYVIIGILFTRQLILVQEGKKEEKNLTVISWVAFIAGLMVMVTSFVFAMQVARPLWNNPVEPVSFLAAALVAAFSLLIILFVYLNQTGRIQISSEKLNKLSQLAGLFLLFELFVVIGEAAIGLYAGEGEEAIIIHWLVSGKGAPFFWVELAAIVVGLILLFQKSSKVSVMAGGASAAIFAIFMIKYNLLQAQLLNPLIPYGGPVGYNPAELGAYIPSLIEVGVSVGIVALGCLLVLIGLNRLDLGTGQKQSSVVTTQPENTVKGTV
ncbi:NrfD/PsrC family molybdoenzyme membrane anchor subunit [Desulfitobacterium hafniense]|nr:NrfD/PsrC family molybdoenzyme membrane anchor subunit [Desulfitobacterium hafniense]